MPFSNPVLGGETLVRTAEKSENYSPGVSGWRITRNGDAEFNTGTFRAAILDGDPSGQHFYINGPTGDPLDIYDASNRLIYSINPLGQAASINYGTGGLVTEAIMAGGEISMQATAGADTSAVYFMAYFPSTGTATQAAERHVVQNQAGTHQFLAEMRAGSDDGTLKPSFVGTEGSIQGSYLISDMVSTDNRTHVFAATGTTNTTGFVTMSHGASFTPTKIICQVHGTGATPSFGVVEVMDGTIDATHFQLYCSQFNGTARNTGAVTVWGIAFG